MARALGRVEVRRRRQQLDSCFAQIRGQDLPGELVAHYSRYLCVLVSGYVEQSVKELFAQYCRATSSPQIQRYAAGQMRRVRNIDQDRLRDLLQSLDPDWWTELQARRPDELSALDSVTAVRNGVSHGMENSVTLGTIAQYYAQVNVVLEDLCERLDPLPGAEPH